MLRAIWKLLMIPLVSLPCILIGLLFYTLPRAAREQLGPALLQFWCRAMCLLFGLEITCRGEPIPQERGLLIVSNHVSYFDIIAIGALLPTSFISKASVKRWPVLGWGGTVAGILFVKRESSGSRRAVVNQAVVHLKRGLNLCLFPEGTTSDGRQLLPFRFGAFKIAMLAERPVLPLTLIYEDVEAVSWIGSATFIGHLLKIGRQKRIGLRLEVSPPARPQLFASAEQFSRVIWEEIEQRRSGRGAPAAPEGAEVEFDPQAFRLDPSAGEAEGLAFVRRLLPLLIRIDSSEPAGELRVSQLVERILKANGLTARHFVSPEGRLNLHACAGDRRQPAVLLLSNADVVPAKVSGWEHAPFAGEEENGVIHGRGALDMKGQLALFLALYIQAAKRSPTPAVQLLVLADEERGGAEGSQFFCRHHLAELNPRLVLGEGGFGLEHFSGLPGPLFLISTAEKGSLWVRLTAKMATMAHSSTPPDEYSTTILLRAIERAMSLERTFQMCPLGEIFVRQVGQQSPLFASLLPLIYNIPLLGPKLLSSIEGNPFVRSMFHNTLAITQFNGGLAPNVIPPRMECVIDFRLHIHETPNDFFYQLREAIDDRRVEIDILHYSPPTQSAYDTEEYEAVRQALLEEYPQAVVSPFLLPASTDMTFFRRAGAQQCFGLFPAALSWPQIESIHGLNEQVSLEQLRRAYRVYRGILQRLQAWG